MGVYRRRFEVEGEGGGYIKGGRMRLEVEVEGGEGIERGGM